MTIYKKFNSALLAVGFVAALAVAAPASAQTLPLTGTLAGTISAYKDGSKTGRVAAEVSGLPAGTLVSGKVLLGKRVLCRAATKKRVTETGTIGIGCNFALRNLAAKKSGARTSQENGQYLTYRVEMLASGEASVPPVIILIPIAITAFKATQ